MKWKWITGVVAGALMLFGGAAIFSQSAAADHGKEVFATQKCSLCHSIAGSGGGEALDGVGARLKPDDIRKRIKAPKDVKANSAMKAYPNLPEKDLNDLIAYLLTLK
jgi:mono/diheme cytochrome c family protein